MSKNRQASEAVRRGQDYFRLKRVVRGPGDTFELNTSVHAVAIGPDSDISEASLVYYDPTVRPALTEVGVVAVGAPWIGRIDAAMDSTYPCGQPARILVYPRQLVPAGPTTANVRVLPAKLDLLAYFSPPPSLPRQRADANFRTLACATPGERGSWQTIILPFYGRHRLHLSVANQSGAKISVSVSASQVDIATGDALGFVRKQLIERTVVPDSACESYTASADVIGLWDQVEVTLDGRMDSEHKVVLHAIASDR